MNHAIKQFVNDQRENQAKIVPLVGSGFFLDRERTSVYPAKFIFPMIERLLALETLRNAAKPSKNMTPELFVR